MKIKDTVKDYDEVCAIKHAPHVKSTEKFIRNLTFVELSDRT